MGLLDLLMPPACAGCGRYGEEVCAACRGELLPASGAADRFVVADPGTVVGDDLEVAVSAFVYGGALRRALSKLKYGGAARLAGPLAEAAAPHLAAVVGAMPDPWLIPVPVHADRLKQRGYNQAALIAANLARIYALPVAAPLERLRPTEQQHRLNRAQRLRNLRQAFAMTPGSRAPPQVVLVDDILTTSATLEACAAAIRLGGGTRVMGVTVARET
jgi:ComF family protein